MRIKREAEAPVLMFLANVEGKAKLTLWWYKAPR